MPGLDQLALAAAGTVLGACVGSFIATLALRSPTDWAGMWLGRSHCPSCGRALGWPDLVPLASWLWLRGRCRSCAAPIAPWYPLVELTAAGHGLIAVTRLPRPAAKLAALLGGGRLALGASDHVAWLLPDALTLPLLAAGLLIAWLGAGPSPLQPAVAPISAALGAVAGYGALAGLALLYRHFRRREGLGLGDAKLLAAAGAWLGIERLPLVLLMAALLGLLTALLRRGPLRSDTAVPFGPALALSFWSAYLAAALA